MNPALAHLRNLGLREWWARYVGSELAPGVEKLRSQQEDAIEWGLSRKESILAINAPTGSGKTLIGAILAVMSGGRWTYTVQTKALQDQAAGMLNVPTVRGRANFECLIGEETHGRAVNADEGICAVGRWCKHSGKEQAGEELSHECDYYAQLHGAMESPMRITNYAMATALQGRLISKNTDYLVCDEAHNVEAAVLNHCEINVSNRAFARFNIEVPPLDETSDWSRWAKGLKLPGQPKGRPDHALFRCQRTIKFLRGLRHEDQRLWLQTRTRHGVKFQPIWGRGLIYPHLMRGTSKVLLMSATLLGEEYVAETLGIKELAYLDLPSAFPAEHRPVIFMPIEHMNRHITKGPVEARAKMQAAIDGLIDKYLSVAPWGLIHAVSNSYRDRILTESRHCGIMTENPLVHAARVKEKAPSVLVAANLTEGWDGVDDLCRFIIMPKLPFPDLGDKRTAIRREEDPRSYDHSTLVTTVQGAGRGVRHKRDTCDTYILDSTYRYLHKNRQSWLPVYFREAFHEIR